MKRVLMIASVASMIDLFNMENIKILSKLGYSVDVACNFEEGSITSQFRVSNFKKELEILNIRSYHIPIPRSLSRTKDIVVSYKEIKNLCSVNKYDLVHCHSPIGGAIARLACKDLRKNDSKIIYTAHGFHFYDGAPLKNWILYYPVEKLLSYYTDVLITINGEDYLKALELNSKKVEYIHGIGLDVNNPKENVINLKDFRKSINVSFDDFMILSVGELNENKNHQIIIRAISKLKNEKIKYVICGIGHLKKTLISLAEEHGVKNQVVFLGYRDDISEIMNVSDLYAFPSYREGLSVSLMESMVNQLPVVCSKIRGNVDLIHDGKGGFLVSPNSVDKMAEKIKILYNDVNLRKSFGEYNYKVVENFSKEKVNVEMFDIYNKILKSID